MLTDRQREIWEFLVRYVEAHGYPPTVREIGQEVGLASPSTVHAHLANLERAGMLRRDPTKPRALELLAPHRRESAAAARARRPPAPPRRPDRGRRSAARRAERRGVPGRARAAGAGRGGVPPARPRRVDDQRRDPGRRLRGRAPSAGRAGTARSSPRSRARTRPPTRRPSSGSTARTAASGCSPRTTRSSPCTRRMCRCWARWSASSGWCRDDRGRAPVPHARPGAVRARPRREPRVPRLRRVRHAGARRAALLRVRLDAGRGGIRDRGAGGTIDHAGRVTASVRARGKSGHRRAGRWGNPRRRKPTESGTERRPPAAIELSGDAGGKGERVG